MPFFSVIIPLYNKENHIRDTLNAVLNQQEQDYEVIIIDDGSTDQGSKIISTYSDPRIHYQFIKNQGVSAARNLGIAKAKGTYVVLLDADDLWYPDHLSHFKESIALYPDHLIFCNNYKIRCSTKLIKETSFSYLPSSERIVCIKNYFRSSLLNSIAWTSATCIHRTIFRDGEKFDVSMSSGQDTDLWIRLGIKHEFIFHTKETAVYRSFIEKSLSNSKNAASRSLMLYKYKEEENTNEFLKKFMDLQRFSICLQYKMLNNFSEFLKIQSEIDFKNLNRKQKFLVRCSPIILKKLTELKSKIATSGLNLSIFK